MASEVIKKDGSREPFDAEKIRRSITIAAEQANLLGERKNEVVEKVTAVTIQMVEGREEVETSEIKEKILSELDLMEPAVSASWRSYDQEKKGG